ncbi:HAMP domain-containing protein [Brevibacillus humidisoli]|uniref:ATP-binding protein n=1 Tax=Brevibacillus humidisoli TaxID=2895522 RepID=UPI001E3BEEA3|nr:ATP-binding protein [Brevibacillus humidisoli]UFJ41104.1 HAMP domain-containing protein [Brevibacillus humidisoli]
MKQKRTIEIKIMIPFLIVVLIPCLAVGSAAYWTGFQSYKHERLQEAENQLNTVISYVNVLERQSLRGELMAEHAKKLAKDLVSDTESVILLEYSGSTHDADLAEDGRSPWWEPYLAKGNGSYKREQGSVSLQEEWVLIHHLPTWEWTIVIPFRLSYIAEPLIDIQKNTLLVMIVAAIVAVQCTIFLSHHLSRPLKNLAAFCQRLGKDEVPEETDLALTRDDEIGVLAHAIKEMLDNMEEKKLLEKRMERMERLASMGQMASGIAHEIRNPLAGIKTTTQVLASRLELDEKNQALFQGVTGEIDRVNRIITNLLNLARPRDPQTRTISVHDVVNQTLVLLEKENKEKNIWFHNRISSELHYLVDPDHFKQIIINLSLNAINAMPAGGAITFSSGLNGELFIQDEGTGIAKEEFEKIFEPFYTTTSTGTGLGLTMVHQLVLQNNGEITIQSEQGKGTVFTLYFPVQGRE